MYACSAIEYKNEPKAVPPAAEHNMAHFWELRGRNVFEMNGVMWGYHRSGFYTCLPLQLCLDLDPEEVNSIIRKASIRGLRIPSLHRPGFPGGMYVVHPAGYDLKSVNRKQRGHVSHGLEVCEIRPVEKQELLRQGMALNCDTLSRQSREDINFIDPAKWKQFVDAVSQCSGMAVQGAFVNGKLVSYVVSCREGAWLHLLYKMSSTADREHYPNHALDYSIIRDAASDPTIQYISNGCLSMIPNEGGDRYKRQMGYQVVEHNLCIYFHPIAASLLASELAISVARLACSAFPQNERLAYGKKILETAMISRHECKRPNLTGGI